MSTTVVTDAAARLIELLAAKGVHSFNYDTVTNIPGLPRSPIPGPVRIGETRIVSTSEMRFDVARQLPLPVMARLVTKIIRNCADTNLNSTVGLSITAVKGWRSAKTRTVATTTGVKVTGRYDTKIFGDYSVDLSWSQNISTQDMEEHSSTETTVININDALAVKPWTAIRVEAKVFQVGVEIPFALDAVVDGDFIVPREIPIYFHPRLPNGISKASQYLSESERTFLVTGVIRIDDVSAASLNIEELKGDLACGKNATKDPVVSEVTIPLAAVSKKWLAKFPSITSIDDEKLTSKVLTDESSIGMPDGISYEVLYTIQNSRMAMECEINDAGLPSPGLFETEYRRYSEYRNGELIRQWEDNEEKFIRCVPI